jgi:hypothetical protein
VVADRHSRHQHADHRKRRHEDERPLSLSRRGHGPTTARRPSNGPWDAFKSRLPGPTATRPYWMPLSGILYRSAAQQIWDVLSVAMSLRPAVRTMRGKHREVVDARRPFSVGRSQSWVVAVVILRAIVMPIVVLAMTISLAAGSVSAEPAATQVITAVSVGPNGDPINGYQEPPSGGNVIAVSDCTTPSPSAVADDIYYCSLSAANAGTCWPSAAGSLLCVDDPWSKRWLPVATQLRTPTSTGWCP